MERQRLLVFNVMVRGVTAPIRINPALIATERKGYGVRSAGVLAKNRRALAFGKETHMKERILTILNTLKAKGQEGLTGGIVDFRPTGSQRFELQTDLSGKTLLKYEIGGDDEILRIEILHGFGHLDLTQTDNPTEFLISLLQENVPSFRDSGACLGVKKESNRLIVLLSSTHQFVATMSDRDIAEALSIAIFDLKMSQSLEFPDPIVTWQ